MTSRWRLTRMRGKGGEGRLALGTPVHVTVDVAAAQPEVAAIA